MEETKFFQSMCAERLSNWPKDTELINDGTWITTQVCLTSNQDSFHDAGSPRMHSLHVILFTFDSHRGYSSLNPSFCNIKYPCLRPNLFASLLSLGLDLFIDLYWSSFFRGCPIYQLAEIFPPFWIVMQIIFYCSPQLEWLPPLSLGKRPCQRLSSTALPETRWLLGGPKNGLFFL